MAFACFSRLEFGRFSSVGGGEFTSTFVVVIALERRGSLFAKLLHASFPLTGSVTYLFPITSHCGNSLFVWELPIFGDVTLSCFEWSLAVELPPSAARVELNIAAVRNGFSMLCAMKKFFGGSFLLHL